MSASDKQVELDALLRKVSDGELDPTDAGRLNDLLRGDPDACERYLNYMALEAGLERECGGQMERASQPWAADEISAPVVLPGFARRETAKAGTVVPFPRWLGYALAACLAFAATLLFQQLRPSPPVGETQAEAAPAMVATLVFAEGCDWGDDREISEGQRLPAGPLGLRRGLAVVRFDGGAELVLAGDAELDLDSAGSARLQRGEVVVRATDGAEGFRLLTPASEVVDLGTEFAVKVERSGATEVHVIEGEVAWHKASRPGSESMLLAGSAVRFDRPETPEPRSVTMNATGFEATVRKANPRERPDLMTVYEGFHYDAGRYAPEEITKGKGWAGPWRLRRGEERQHSDDAEATTDMQIVHGKLNVPWPVEGGRLGMLEAPAGQFFRVRPMAAPIELDRDGITYFSLMTQEPDHSARRERSRPYESVRLTFRSSADYWGESLSFGLGSRLRPVIQIVPGGRYESLADVPEEQSLLWIGKIIRRADGEDEISFRIYGQGDPLDYAEPATWHVTTRDVRQSAKLDLVVLSSTGTSPRIVDELRIGPTWRSVVPIRNPTIAVK